MSSPLSLEEYNKKEIDQIDECKRELIDLCKQQQQLYKDISWVFEKIKAIGFSKRVQNPCTYCLVSAACSEECIHKKKQVLISQIKQERKSPSFVSKNTDRIFGANNLTRNNLWIKKAIYPSGWELE